MRRFRIPAFIGVIVLVSGLLGCSSGGDPPKPLTVDELLVRGQAQLESVTTNWMMNPGDARTALRSAARDFSSALAQSPDNAQGRMGYALATTLQGFFDLIEVFPDRVDAMLRSAVMDRRMRQGNAWMTSDLAEMPAPGTRASATQTAQLRILSSTMPSIRQALPLFSDIETAVGEGQVVRLRLYQDGRVQTVIFDVADVQLVCAFAHLVNGLLNVAIAYNLDMPAGIPVRAPATDGNGNTLLDPEEYLISAPFLNSFYPQQLPTLLEQLALAAAKAQSGSSLTGHTAGASALVDVSDPAVQEWLDNLGASASILKTACTSPVTTDRFFGDGALRTLDLRKLTSISNLRPLLPSFPVGDDDAVGAWPDQTFNGAIVPGVPSDYLHVTYRDIEGGY